MMQKQLTSFSSVISVVFAGLRLIGLAFTFIACAPEASDTEIEKMCQHLTELRNKKNDQEMKQQCIDEAHQEKVSQKQARCRISAVNKTEYWVRCRTGEARK